jgi:hypothetical protein
MLSVLCLATVRYRDGYGHMSDFLNPLANGYAPHILVPLVSDSRRPRSGTISSIVFTGQRENSGVKGIFGSTY